MKKIICIFIGIVIVNFVCSAEKKAEKNNIELPDLTTEVTTNSQDAENISGPAFEDIIELPKTTGNLVPELPDVELQEENELVLSATEENKNQIYAEGQIGGGYPASFIGDFSVAKILGKNPFKISFNHKSNAGYSGHELSEGFNNDKTVIGINKKITFDKMELGLNGIYEAQGNGLQGKAESISSINQNIISGDVDFLWQLPNNFLLQSDIFSDFYCRFADLTYNSSDNFDCPNWIKKQNLFSLKPSAKIEWQNNNIEAGFFAGYSFIDNSINRGQFVFDFSWNNEIVNVFANVALVTGTNINDNRVICPFSIGVNSAFPVYFSDRKVSVTAEGGLKSEQKSISDYERQYKFSAFSYKPAETTDWYSSVKFLLPLKTAFTANLKIDFTKSAFGSQKYMPLYNSNDSAALYNGIYEYTKKNWTELVTNLDFTYKYQLFAVTVKWHANWIDVPVLENKHDFSVILSLQGKEGNWGTSLESYYSIDAADKTPKMNFSSYIQLSSAVKIVFDADDIIKLVTLKTRNYAGDYISNSGNVTMLIKFLF